MSPWSILDVNVERKQIFSGDGQETISIYRLARQIPATVKIASPWLTEREFPSPRLSCKMSLISAARANRLHLMDVGGLR